MGIPAASRGFRLTLILRCRSISIMVPDRRDFIKKALAGMLVILGLGFLIPSLRIFSPAGNRDKELVFFPLISEDEVPRSGVRKSELAYAISGKERKVRVFIVSTSNGLSVFSATCTHLGCLVNYNKEKHEFVCPCHGGRYDLTGKNIAGPPPAPLTRLPIQTQKGMIAVGIKV
jgi:Rieske Fe-S protein